MLIDSKDARIALLTTYYSNGHKRAVVQVKLAKHKKRIYSLWVFKDRFDDEVVRLHCNWTEQDRKHRIDFRIPLTDFVEVS